MKKKKDKKKKKIKNNLLLLTKEPKIKKNSRLKWKHRDLRNKKKEKSNALESCKKKLLIVKQKLMPFVPSVLLRKEKDKLVSAKDWSTRKDYASKQILSWPVKDNFLRRQQVWLSRHA